MATQKENWLEAQAVRKELARWKISKYKEPEGYYRREIEFEVNFQSKIAESFILSLISHLQALRTELAPTTYKNCIDEITTRTKHMCSAAIRRLGNDAYSYSHRTSIGVKDIDVVAGICVTTDFNIYCTERWRKLYERNAISFKRKLVTKIIKKIPHNRYDIYYVKFVEAEGRRTRHHLGYIAVLNNVGRLSSTKQGALSALTRTVKSEVLEALT